VSAAAFEAPASSVRPTLDRIVVINDVAAAQGGATALALESIRMFREIDIPVTFIVGGDQTNDEIEEAGADIVVLGGRHIASGGRLSAFGRGLYNPAISGKLARWIAGHDTPSTIYHLHGWSKVLSPAIFSALRPVAARTVVHAHDFFLACPNGAYQDYRRGEPCERVPLGASCLTTNCDKRSYAQKLWRAARHEALSLACASGYEETPVVMIHQGMRPFFTRAGYDEKRLVTIRNPVRPFSEKRITAEDHEIIYFVGRIEAEKGVFDLAKAARTAGVTLKMIGDGPARSEIQSRYPEIDVAGWLDRRAIGRALSDARALVMPSLYREPFGLVAMEASTSGLPVILSGNALLAKDIADAGLGIAFDPARGGALADALKNVAELPREQIKAMSEAAFARPGDIATTPAQWRDQLLALYATRTAAAYPRHPSTMKVAS
jgi:glycosyltransferase involved in cell wall biosynthesis